MAFPHTHNTHTHTHTHVHALSGFVVANVTPGNTTLTLNRERPSAFQFRCDVQSLAIPTIMWTFISTLNPVPRQLSNGTLDPAYTIMSMDPRISILNVNNVQVQNDGIYTCTATESLCR